LLSDAGGVTIGYAVEMEGEQLFNLIDCVYDSHANWTACRQIVRTPAGNAVVKMWRRTITYR
jgi:hypothetical protein